MTATNPRFGVWCMVYGSWASYHHPEDPVDASWERNRRQIIEAEELGYDSTLVAQHIFNPSGDQYDQLEAWTGSAALAALTSRIEIITAIKPYLLHPVVLAKMALQIDAISEGRNAINVVNAWFKPEFERAGMLFAHHDERYVYGREWLDVVDSLMRGQRTSFAGRYFDVQDYQLRPASPYRERPTIYVGGESDGARTLAVDTADVFFMNGQPPERIAAIVKDVSSRPRGGRPIRFGMAAYVIARDTDEEARAELAAAWRLAALDSDEHDSVYLNADPDSAMWKTLDELPHIGSNGGTAAGLVGSYDTVASRIQELVDIGVETFMVQFQPFEPEMRRFSHEVIPRVRRLARVAA
jgi:alkanesulfonate monooxygenase